MGGFDRPILHGLASYGVTCRLILQQYANNDPSVFKSMKVSEKMYGLVWECWYIYLNFLG